MFASLLLSVRILFAWLIALGLVESMWIRIFGEPGSLFGMIILVLLVLLVLLMMAAMSVVTHSHRVRLLAGRLDRDTLSSRHRRQIEIPLDSRATFALVDAAIRELPRVEAIESLPASLQVRAKVPRSDGYEGHKPSRWNVFARFTIKRDRVLATITPGTCTSSTMLVFEPDAAAWFDLFAVDEGNNYENAEAVRRTLTRQVAEQRRDE